MIIILIAAFLLGNISCPKRERIFATVFLRPPNGLSIPKDPYFGLIDTAEFTPTEETKNGAIRELKELGFEIEYEGRYSITFYSSKDHFEETFNTEVVTKEYSPIGEDFLREIENTLNAPENGSVKTTFAYIEAIPNPVGVDQEVLLHFGITDATGSTAIGWEGLTTTVTKPDGSTEILGPFTTNSTGGTVVTYFPTIVGIYTLQTHFPEQISPLGAIMLESSSDPLELVVQEESISISPDQPLTEFYSPYEDFLREIENTPNVNVEDFIYVSHQFTQPITIPENLEPYVEDVKLPPPVYSSFFHLPDPPSVPYYHLEMLNGLKDKLNVSGTQDWPIPDRLNGTGIKVAIIDSGFYNHPFFDDRLESNVPTVIGPLPSYDTLGHGTVVAANLLAVAPKVDLYMVKQKLALDHDFIDPYSSFEKALTVDPKIISCSWKCDFDWGLQHYIKEIIKANITVVFACGNYKQNGNVPTFPGAIPEVISVGGAYPDEDGNWNASSYARSGEHPKYPGRNCPDVCGVVGQAPYGRLIMSPVGVVGDLYSSILHFDLTSPIDGWAVLSGTSSAAPQVAGAVALMLQINPSLTPLEVKGILNITATDVSSGISASGDHATSGQFAVTTGSGVIMINVPDVATGYGVVNVNGAIKETIGRLP